MRYALLLLCAVPALAAPPKLTRIASRDEFVARAGALHGVDSPAQRLARYVTREGKPDMAVLEAPFGVALFAWSMDDDFLATIAPDGHLTCEADGGPCPDEDALEPLPDDVLYEVNVCMGTPSGIGCGDAFLVPLGGDESVGVVRAYSSGDGYPERYEVVELGASGFGRVLHSGASAYRDLDHDGRLDAVVREQWGSPRDELVVEWEDWAFGDGEGEFAPDPKRSAAMHRDALSVWLGVLRGQEPDPVPDGESVCLAGVEPILHAYVRSNLGGLPLKPLVGPSRRWLQLAGKAYGARWTKECPHTIALSRCLLKVRRPGADALRACLAIDPD